MPAKPVCLAAVALAKPLEGLYLTADLCPAGVPTLGFGHTGPDMRLGMASPGAGRAAAGSRPGGRCGPRRQGCPRPAAGGSARSGVVLRRQLGRRGDAW